MSGMWDRAVTFDANTPTLEVQKTLISIANAMGKEGYGISHVIGPFILQEESGPKVYVLKVISKEASSGSNRGKQKEAD